MAKRKTHEKDIQKLLERCLPLLQERIVWLRDAPARLTRAIRRIPLSRPTPKGRGAIYSDHPEYQAAIKLRKDFTPKEDCDYAWAIDFAKESYKELDETFRYLDEKADAIIKYMGGGTAAVTLTSLMAVSRSSGWLPLLFIPSVAFALRAIHYATQARRPTTRPNSPPV